MRLTRCLTRRALGWLASVSVITLISCSSTDEADVNLSSADEAQYDAGRGEIQEARGLPTFEDDSGTVRLEDNGIPSNCPRVSVQISRLKPRIIFAIDRSGSMGEPFRGSTTRWEAIRSALMEPKDGIVATLQSVAFFGLVIYDGPLPSPLGTGEKCPNLVPVNPELNNFTAIDKVFPTKAPEPNSSSTPTAAALDEAYRLISSSSDDSEASGVVVLCTDGEPNRCIDSSQETSQFVVSSSGAVELASDYETPVKSISGAMELGIRTFVINLVSGTQQYEQQLEELARVGAGSPVVAPTTQEELSLRLKEIMTKAIGCKVKLHARVDSENACQGTVELNGRPLICEDPDGWLPIDENHIELQGASCTSFINSPTAILHASFPCHVVVLE
jgi:hypothetical protein